MVGDAEGVLHAYMRFKADDPKINEMIMELAVRIAPTGRGPTTFHVFSEHNAQADCLSRVAAGAPLPPQVAEVARTKVALGPWRFLEG